MEGKKNNGYFKWVTLAASVLFMIISASFSYTLLTNKRVDRLDVKLDEIATDVSYIRGLLDGNSNKSGTYLHAENSVNPDGNNFRDNAATFIRTCYRVLLDKDAEQEVFVPDQRIE